MCKELLLEMLDNSLPIYLSLNRDKFDQGRKVTNTHRNPWTKVYSSKNCLLNLPPESKGETLASLDKVRHCFEWPYRVLKLKIHNNRSGSEMTKNSEVFPTSYLRTVHVNLLKTGFPHCPWKVFVISIFSCTMLYCYRKNPICQQF